MSIRKDKQRVTLSLDSEMWGRVNDLAKAAQMPQNWFSRAIEEHFLPVVLGMVEEALKKQILTKEEFLKEVAKPVFKKKMARLD